jgi:hypothetical protein
VKSGEAWNVRASHFFSGDLRVILMLIAPSRKDHVSKTVTKEHSKELCCCYRLYPPNEQS